MIIGMLLLAALVWFLIETTIMIPFFGGTFRFIVMRRDWRAQRDLPRVASVPRYQLHMRHGWWYIEYLDDGLASGLCTYEFAKNHAACFKDARPRCHPSASWWSRSPKDVEVLA